jgi:integrase-like protein
LGERLRAHERRCDRVLKRAGLPGHCTMHSLRHSFCSLLISSGVSPVYVQQQAGHADVSFTVRVYGSGSRRLRPAPWTASPRTLLARLQVVLHLLAPKVSRTKGRRPPQLQLIQRLTMTTKPRETSVVTALRIRPVTTVVTRQPS